MKISYNFFFKKRKEALFTSKFYHLFLFYCDSSAVAAEDQIQTGYWIRFNPVGLQRPLTNHWLMVFACVTEKHSLDVHQTARVH